MKDKQYIELLKRSIDRGKHLQERSDEILQEDFKSFLKGLSINKIKGMLSKLKDAATNSNLKMIKRVLAPFSKISIPMSLAKKVARKMSPGFDKSYSIIIKYMKKNKLPTETGDCLSSAIAIVCGKTKDPVKSTKSALKKLDNYVQKKKGKVEKEQITLTVAALSAFIYGSIFVIIGLIPLFVLPAIVPVVALALWFIDKVD